MLIAPRAVIGYDPEGPVTITTLAVDTDYLIEHLFWQHLAVIPDRDAARDLAAKLYLGSANTSARAATSNAALRAIAMGALWPKA